jgi:membrane-associated phospholipid phosphatase
MRKNRKALILVLAVLCIFVSFYFDAEIVRFFSSLKNSYLDVLFRIIGYVSSEIGLIIIFAVLIFYERNKRKNLIPLGVTLFFTALVGFILKVTIQRLRPFQAGVVDILPSLVQESYSVWNYSFPSSHAMFVFCAVPLIEKEFPKLK